MEDSFNTESTLKVGDETYRIYRLTGLPGADRLPFSLKILLENLLRHEDGSTVTSDDIQALLDWEPSAKASQEIAFRPARVLMQDFTGVPAVVDLAAMRDAMGVLGGDPERINPLQPAELVIDHSVQVDRFGTDAGVRPQCRSWNIERNRERYAVPQMGPERVQQFQGRAAGYRHRAPGQPRISGADVVDAQERNDGMMEAYPDTLVGTDSHTTMINGIGVLGWGVGGIEAEAAMLGQPISMLIPRVVGFRLTGSLPEGATGTDLVLTVVRDAARARAWWANSSNSWRRAGPAVARGPRDDRQHGAGIRGNLRAVPDRRRDASTTCVSTGRDEHLAARVEAYAREQGIWREPGAASVEYTAKRLSWISVRSSPAMAGPKRPAGPGAAARGGRSIPGSAGGNQPGAQQVDARIPWKSRSTDRPAPIGDGLVVIAAITSCTNTSNPSVMVAAGSGREEGARQLGLQAKPLGQNVPGARIARGDRLPGTGRPDGRRWTRSRLLTWSATAAPPASAIPAPCRNRSRTSSGRTT